MSKLYFNATKAFNCSSAVCVCVCVYQDKQFKITKEYALRSQISMADNQVMAIRV